MPLNLITDAWIPVIRYGKPVTICPHEIAAAGVERLDWPREDLNLACMELLIGLIFLTDPPSNDSEWHERYCSPDPERLRSVFGRFSPHFELDSPGPRFLQDLEPFEKQAKRTDILLPDMLFIDSAGRNTAEKNSDLMVKRKRYTSLDLPLAAISLYTLQAFAPSGGAGNRTSMRGGGPLVSLMKPLNGGTHPLWKYVWCNVPEGQRLDTKDAALALPWLRPTITSEKNQIVTPEMSHDAEAFFGMPRRIRLVFKGDTLKGVVQRPHGTNYKHWLHPLSPYYCMKAGGERLPVHPKPGRISYRNWLGLAFGKDSEKRYKAYAVSRFHSLLDAPDTEVCVGGWAMRNMLACDFNLDVCPTFNLDADAEMDMRVSQLVEAANFTVKQLSKSLSNAVGLQGTAAETVNESFFISTERDFISAVRDITSGKGADVERNWITKLRQIALMHFDQYTLPTLSEQHVSNIERAVKARRDLLSKFHGNRGVGKFFPDLFNAN